MSLDKEKLKKILKKEEKEKEAKKEVSEEKEFVKVIKKIVDSKTGRVITREERWVRVGSEESVVKEEIVYAVGTCETCGRPVTQELLTRHEIKTCLICGRDTCPACRVNTSIPNIDVKYRGQVICENCFRSFGQCAICGTFTYNITRCRRCGKTVCDTHSRQSPFIYWEATWRLCPECYEYEYWLKYG